jgi:hypothetical protein
MTNDKLNDLLQEWAAARIRFSSKHGRASLRLGKIMEKILEAQRGQQQSSPDQSLRAEAPEMEPTSRKHPVSVETIGRNRRDNMA